MTSLKVQYANEIAEAMAKRLGDDEFLSVFQKSASLQKEAGAALEAYKADLANVKDKAGLDAAWNKHVGKVTQEEESLQEMTCLQATKAKELSLPGYATPGCTDDEQRAEDAEQAADEQHACPEREEMPAWDIAADFTLAHLAKVADALDSKGFKTLANDIDEIMLKIAKKKKEKEDEKNDDKDDKKKKKGKLPPWLDKDKKDKDKDDEKEDKKDKKDKDKKDKDEKENDNDKDKKSK